MEQRISLVTLGVSDVGRARAFYEALGWRGQTVQQTVFFQAGGLGLVLWSREELAADAGVDAGGTGFAGVVLAHNVRTREEVDALLAAAAGAGAGVTRSAADTFYGGYAGCFRDPEGHLWEVAWNPGFPIGPDGGITIPDLGQRS